MQTGINLFHILYSFFFQAEDGIRDGHVTGVQTCALPISAIAGQEFLEELLACDGGHRPREMASSSSAGERSSAAARSEERRVGKECRYWWWWCPSEKKK